MRLAVALAVLALTACGSIDDSARQLAFAPENLICGWSLDRTEQLPELPAGRCWRLTPGDTLATSPAGTDPCDVKAGARTYQGGEFVDMWGTTGPDHGDRPYSQDRVDCP